MPTIATPAWVVKDVKAQSDYTLLLTFADGRKRRNTSTSAANQSNNA